MKGLSKLLAARAAGTTANPAQVPVQATYDGFSRRYNTYAYATETLEDGLAYVKVNNPHGAGGEENRRTDQRL